MSAGWTLCLDFGTSNTAASFRKDDGRPEPVPLTDDSSQMPSAVLVTDNGIRVGLEAVRMARLSPEGFEESPKSRLGEGQVWLHDREVEVVDLVGAVLRHAALRAQRMAGGAVPHTVLLTHPIDWAGPRREALRTAWDRTGLRGPQVRLVPEPVAAVTWFAGQRTVRKDDRVAVLDIGAGTSDVAVLQATGEVREPWRLIAHGGEDDLGGRLVDEVLMEWVDRTLADLGRDDLRAALADPANLGARLTARDQTRHAKHALSEWEDSSIPIVVGGQQHTLTLTYDELATLTAPVVARMTTLLERTLREAALRAGELDALYLTGGSSQLRNLVGAMGSLVGDRLASLEHPKLVVCLGAHQAADLAATAAPLRRADPEPRPAPEREATAPLPPPVPPERNDTGPVLPPPPPPERPEDRVGGGADSTGGGTSGTGGHAGRSSSLKPWAWAAAAGAAVLLLSGIGIALAASDDAGSDTGTTPTSPASGPTSPATSPSGASPLEDAFPVLFSSRWSCTPQDPTEGITEVQGCTNDDGYLEIYQWNSAADAALDAQQHEQGRRDDGSLVSVGDWDLGSETQGTLLESKFATGEYGYELVGYYDASPFSYQLYADNKRQTYRLWRDLELKDAGELPQVP